MIGVPNGNGENGDVARDAGLAAVEDICLRGVTSSMASNGEKGAEEAPGGRSREDIAQLLRNVGGDFRTCMQHVGPEEGYESVRHVDGKPISIDSVSPLAWFVCIDSPRGQDGVGA